LCGEMRGGDLNWRPFAWRPIFNGDFVSGDFRSGELRRSRREGPDLRTHARTVWPTAIKFSFVWACYMLRISYALFLRVGTLALSFGGGGHIIRPQGMT